MDQTNRRPNRIMIDGLQYSKPSRERFLEWQRGGLGCVHNTIAVWESARETLRQIGEWNRALAENNDLVQLGRSARDIHAIIDSGRTAVIYGFQDTSPFEDDIELVSIFRDLGVRIVQLTYNVQNRIASGCWEEDDKGLSKFFGRNFVKECNDLGILIDLSHCNEQTCLDTIEFSAKPVAITHGNPAEFVGQEVELPRRNRSTDVLKLLIEAGGIIGLSNYPKITKGGSQATLESFSEMVAWTVERLGVDSVALASDWAAGWPDGMLKWWRAGRWARESPIPIKKINNSQSWFQGPRDFPIFAEALQKRGFSNDEIDKIVGGNWLRFFDGAFASTSEAKAHAPV